MASVLSARTPLRHDSHQTDEGSRRPTLSLVAAVALGFGRGSEPEEMQRGIQGCECVAGEQLARGPTQNFLTR
jgi:hypothetical protein